MPKMKSLCLAQGLFTYAVADLSRRLVKNRLQKIGALPYLGAGTSRSSFSFQSVKKISEQKPPFPLSVLLFI